MKKGLLSILAASLLVVGCQDYDDQFSSLESQISALATTVAGLSQVQSDIAALSGTVASLSSTVNGLGDAIDTAVSDGLADIQSDIDTIEAAVADVASSEEVSTLSDAISDAQDDLTDLLEASSVFTGDVIVNSASTLDAYLAMGSALNIVNGNVTITVSTDMDQTKVQELVDNILTIVKDLSYTSNAASIAETTFDNLTGVQSITITQGGGMRFPNLISATVVRLNDDFESGTNPVDVIHFGSLTSVTSFQTNATANTIEFLKATELHLTALPRYGSALSLKIDEGSTLLIPVLASVDADGDESTLDLTVEGASSLDFSLITDGDISAKDVATVTGGADHDGTITLDGVTKAVIPNFTRSLTVTGTTLEYLHVIGATPKVQTGATAVTTTPGLDLTGQSDLETVIIDGTLGAVVLSGNTKLTDITYTANSESLSITGANDLTALAIAGTTKSLSVTSNTDLESLVITTELNTAKGNASAVSTSGSLTITNNADLETIATAYDPVSSMTIQTNTSLVSIDLTGTELVGGTDDKATVAISGNALNATKVVDKFVTGETGVGTGSITDEALLSTMKTYLTAAVAAATSVVVTLDTVDLKVDEATTAGAADTETSDVTDWDVVNVVPVVTTGAVTGSKGKKAIEIAAGATLTIAHTDPNTSIETAITGSITLNSNPTLAAAQILSDANGYVANAASVGVTLNAYVGGSSSIVITILGDNDSTTNEAANANSGAASTTDLADGDVVGLTIGGVTATDIFGAGATTTGAIATRIASIWNTKYPSTDTNTAFTASADTASGTITLSADQSAGSRFDGSAVALIVTTGTDTTTDPVVGHKIGALKTAEDNVTKSSKVIITAESENTGVDYNTIQANAVDFTGGIALSVTSTYTAAPAINVFRADAFSDARNAVDSDAGTSTTASTTNYLTWVE